MKDIKLSFPYPSTSRHNLSQDVALSLSMGLVTPVRIVEVLPGDSHRIGTSFSLISNPLVKPLLQGVRMRYCRFWVPRRIYHLAQRANNSDFDPRTAPVRYGTISNLLLPATKNQSGYQPRKPIGVFQYANFQASCLFDYLGVASIESNFFTDKALPDSTGPFLGVSGTAAGASLFRFNAEPYLAYVDICRNYFADSASGTVAWCMPYKYTSQSDLFYFNSLRCTVVSPLVSLDKYIDGVQNSVGVVNPYNPMSTGSDPNAFEPVQLGYGLTQDYTIPDPMPAPASFSADFFGLSHAGLCVPLNRPDRFSRSFDTRPLTSQNATINSSEITIANLSFLSKLQRYLTRKFFGGSRYTDVMYSVFGQRVPHVDSPVCLDVFDAEIGSELVASTNVTESQNPGVLGGYFSASGVLSTDGGRRRRRYIFNESGYLIDVVYIMPRIFRSSYYPDFYPVVTAANSMHANMAQGNFLPDMNGIGWQQPAYVNNYVYVSSQSDTLATVVSYPGFVSEPSWQQYRTLPDVCHGLLNVNRSATTNVRSSGVELGRVNGDVSLNSPLFIFNDRPWGYNVVKSNDSSVSESNVNSAYFRMIYTDFNSFNSVFGTDQLTLDNIFCVFRYAHQAKRQVSKRFTLSF